MGIKHVRKPQEKKDVEEEGKKERKESKQMELAEGNPLESGFPKILPIRA